ncbi:hypothetical protein IFM89_008469 [Coptis chinensis]|uniref:Membrane-associated kinase regulator 4 n=1 Tax=Coptis chinensis TaxID=261450 RepID=A0A835LHD5_9MAGN|nr:hypothetical protein IFM89_008469 [Coptis chinensis]
MDRNSSVCDNVDEDYIDMDVSSSTFFCYSPHPREFEFQMSSGSLVRDTTTSPADELFYKGKLLPLHLPPRLQMVQKLLLNTNTSYGNKEGEFEDNYITPSTTSTPTFHTPLESCNISPSGSSRVSKELTPDECFFECTNEMSRFIDENPKKSWAKKFKLIKQSSLGHKLKASRAYLKSLFSKSGCSDESCTEAAGNGAEGTVSKAKECLNKYIKVAKKNPFGHIHRERYLESAKSAIRGTDREKMIEDGDRHRRSFSGAIINRHSATKSSSSSSSSNSSSSSFSSSNSNGFYELHLLKRSSSANSEFESSVQGAIAHCKQSQQLFHSKKSKSEVGFCSLSASRIAACSDQERAGLCRG